jgi:hypothetical protein
MNSTNKEYKNEKFVWSTGNTFQRSVKSISLFKFLFVIVLSVLFQTENLFAWSEHPLLVKPALKDHPVWKTTAKVEAKNLKTFLILLEKEIEVFLAQQEKWSNENLPNYTPMPEKLLFRATGNPDDILLRFYSAIRINPNVKIPLYLHLLPNENAGKREIADPNKITTLEDIGSMMHTTYVWIKEGEEVVPFDVLATANDEPDYGFDLGLFEDNNTEYGKRYGFGKQPFGNPNLEYSSQAPFHMGFFHEAGILYKFGPFLKHTYIDYRIFLYKALSEFAFEHNQPYWGWRFMGWGMHYVGDVSMPYHMKPLPGVSTSRMLWINAKSIIGASKARDNAVQIVSNRHTVFEEFQVQILRKANQQNDTEHPFLVALQNPVPIVPFSYDFLINVATLESAEKSKEVDKVLKKNMPPRMVSDPAIEVSELPEMARLAEVVLEEKGEDSALALTQMIAERMRSFSMHIRSYMDSILNSVGEWR